MKLGWTEWWLMNNPVRSIAQKYLEAPQLKRMGGSRADALALEIGCGSGGGISVIQTAFQADRVHAFDLDPRMIHHAAKKKRRDHPPLLWAGNVRHLPVRDGLYDAAFDFGVLHHVVDWPSALGEIHRVLKPGGRFYIEEITRQFIIHPLWRMLLDHPQKNRFDRHDLVGALKRTGFTVRRSMTFAGLFIWCIADKNMG